ncbi:hypothetical protein [Paenibacillus tarimensis]|uniref:hypothetical protein n=1 Tax=Paenibacillus tarimensis TaxID=416012 RepID=UPI001F299057|nr:hypothetical protein [Paenibacillus tarimensis]MCF2943284.1 hypothetical protein [Paenibacillus tarimensis]
MDKPKFKMGARKMADTEHQVTGHTGAAWVNKPVKANGVTKAEAFTNRSKPAK